MPLTDLAGGHVLGNSGVFSDTTRFVYGNASARFTAANSTYLTIPSDTDPSLNPYFQGNLAPASMTYEFWFYPASTTSSATLFQVHNPNSDGTGISGYVLLTLSNLTVTLNSVASSAFNQSTAGTAINGWNHVAIVWPTTGGVVLYLNGIQIGGLAWLNYHFFSQPIYIGWGGPLGGSFFDGWIDDLRYTPSTRYGANFTPGYAPAAPVWSTADSLTLATGTEGQTVNATILANAVDPQAAGIFKYGVKTQSYSLDNFSVSNTGLVTATLPPSNSPFTFTIDAIDTNGNHSKTHTYTLQSAVTTIPELKYSWRFDAANTSTFVAPNVGTGTPSVANGTATYTAAPAPYSANNAIHLQSNAQITMATSTNFEFLANAAWTVEFWADINSSPVANNSTLLSVGPLTGNTGNEFRVFNNVNGAYTFGSQSTFGAAGAGVDFSAPTAGWNHFAVVRDGTSVSTFMNGTLCNTLSNAATLSTVLYDNGQLTINGLTGSATGKAFSDLYLRGLNFFNVAKYTESFTPVWNDYFQPIWKSNAGIVFNAWEGNAITNVSVLAEAFGANNTLTYSIGAGSMPSGVTISANGAITGTVPPFSHTSNSPSFTLIATDLNSSFTANRSFIVNAITTAPTFANANLGYGVSNTVVSNFVLNAFDPRGLPVTYSVQNGSTLPSNLTLASNGLVSGSLTQVTTDTTYQFVVNAVNNAGQYNPSTLSFTNYTSADPLFLNTSLLLHADGSFQDTSPANTTVTVVGSNAVISNAASKWGNSSILINNISTSTTPAGYITAPFTGITGDWTVEMWINLPSLRLVAGNATEYLFTYTSGINGTNSFANSIFTCFLGSAGVSNGVQYFGCRSYTSTGTQNGSDIGSNNTVGLLTLNAWHNVAVTRQGTNVYLFWDGVLVNSGTIPAFQNVAGSFFFGVGGNSQAQLPFYGYMDDIRVTQGVARYTANYTVQPYAYASIRDQSPLWSTANTNVAFDSNGTASVYLNANAAAGTTASYSLASGSLPSGLTLNSNGLVSGQTNTVVYQGQSAIWSNSIISATDSASASFTSVQPVSYAVQQNDIYWANVATLIHAEDTPNSTVLTDSAGKLTYTLGSALVSTANKKFGSSSLFFNGTTSATGIAQSQVNPSSVNFGTNAFTMEAWVYPTSLAIGRAAILSLKNPTTGPVTTDLAFYWHLSGSNTQANAIVLELDTQSIQVSAAAAITMNAWNHVAFVRSGATFSFFLNGTLLTTRNDTAAPTAATSIPFPSGSTLQIGGLTYAGTSSNLGGYMDEIRITNGTARYTGNFVVQQLSWPNSADTTPFWSTANTNIALDTAVVESIQLSAPSGVRTPNSTFSVLSGSLPSGLTLNSNGLVTGATQALAIGSNVVVSNSTILATNGQYSNTAALSYVVQPADQFWTNTTLLHADGNYIDNGGNALVWTSAGGAGLSNTVSKLGTGSFSFPGTHGAWVTSNVVPAQFNLGSNNWTVELWANVVAFPSNTGYGDVGSNSSSLFGIGANGTNALNALNIGVGGTGPTSDITSFSWKSWNGASSVGGVGVATVDLPLNTWNHYVAQRTGNFVQLYVNGNLLSNVAMTNAISYSASYFVTLGSIQANGGGGLNSNIFYYPLQGFIDEFRLTLNQARYTGNFTVQQYSYPNQGDPTPIWSMANTNLVFDSYANTNVALSAPSVAGAIPAYSVVSGSMPSGLTLNSNGVITGVTTGIAAGGNAVVYNATVLANHNGFVANTDVSYTVQADDPYFNNTVMLIHAEDTANGTTLIDSTGKQTLSFNSGGSVSTANQKFGQSSIYLPGVYSLSNIIKSGTNPTGLNFGSGDFTMEAWVYPISMLFSNTGQGNGTYRAAMLGLRVPGAASSAANFPWVFMFSSATATGNISQVWFEGYNSGGTSISSVSAFGTVSIPLNQWHHFAISRQNGTGYLFVDGTLVASGALGALQYPASAQLHIGGYSYGSSITTNDSGNFNGYMDEIRITNGTARYTANFTVAALPFPSSQDRSQILFTAPVGANTNAGFLNTLSAYSNAQVFTTIGSDNGTNYTVTAGSIPAGLSLLSNGVLTGITNTVVNSTTANFTVQASNPGGFSNSVNMTYNIAAPDPFIANTVLQLRAAKGFNDMMGGLTITPIGNTTIVPYNTLPNDQSAYRITTTTAAGQLASIQTSTIPATKSIGADATHNYTIEMWVNLVSLGYDNQEASGWAAALFNQGDPRNNPNGNINQTIIQLYSTVNTTTTTSLLWRYYGSTGTGPDAADMGFSFTNTNQFKIGQNVWNHVAFVRNNNVHTMYFNGVALNSSTNSYVPTWDSAQVFSFGTYGIQSSNFYYPFNGYMDDIRVTVGVARYTSNFTPPGALGR